MTAATLKPFDHTIANWPLARLDILHPALEGKQANEYSQFGEDGLLEALFRLIGTENQWCFEVGAANGVWYSNTKRLRDAGWRALLIEGDRTKADLLTMNCRRREHPVCEHIGGVVRLDGILERHDVPRGMELGVIDIDGQDYWAWYDMERYTPRVMLVEFAPDPKLDRFIPDRGGEGQAGCQAILDMGTFKGYRPIAITAVNVLFVRGELWTE